MKKLLAILLVCLAAAVGTFIGTTLANKQLAERQATQPAKQVTTQDAKQIVDQTSKELFTVNLQKDIKVPKDIKLTDTKDPDKVYKYIMENPVDQSMEEILKNLVFVGYGLRKEIECNQDLYMRAKNSLSEDDYKLYVWDRMRLYALEYLEPHWSGVSSGGGYHAWPLEIPNDEEDFDTNLYGETQQIPLQPYENYNIMKGVAYLLDKRLWMIEGFWRPLDKKTPSVGYTTEVRIIGDLSLKDYTDHMLRRTFAKYDEEKLVAKVNQYRSLKKDQQEVIDDLVLNYHTIPDYDIEVISIWRADK